MGKNGHFLAKIVILWSKTGKIVAKTGIF